MTDWSGIGQVVAALMGPPKEVDHTAAVGSLFVYVAAAIQSGNDFSYAGVLRHDLALREEIRRAIPRRRDWRKREAALKAASARDREYDPQLAVESRRATVAAWGWSSLLVGSGVLAWDSVEPGSLAERAVVRSFIAAVLVAWIVWMAVTAPRPGRSSAASRFSTGEDGASAGDGASPVVSRAHARDGDVRACVDVSRGSVPVCASASASVTVGGVTASAEARVGPEPEPAPLPEPEPRGASRWRRRRP